MGRRYRHLLPMLLVLIALALGLAGCGPEAARSLGDGRGSGADVGNRDPDVETHGETERDERIYYQLEAQNPAPTE